MTLTRFPVQTVQPTSATLRVLIVDDQDLLRQLCGRILETCGHRVLEATTGAQAIRLYQEERPDAVLLDIGIPDMDGIAVLEELRRIDPRARVAMLTGERRPEAVRRALSLGARDYIVKPFYSERLKTAIDRLLA
ncbi:MAG TPA: response regulator [Chloroflexota bacterium]|jgi:two-component system chemotaxis response regulator CheY|nr:response regulator [Chloroflexota bacterium]